jgi:hypothetical protein
MSTGLINEHYFRVIKVHLKVSPTHFVLCSELKEVRGMV